MRKTKYPLYFVNTLSLLLWSRVISVAGEKKILQSSIRCSVEREIESEAVFPH